MPQNRPQRLFTGTREVRFSDTDVGNSSGKLLDIVLGIATAAVAIGCLAGLMTLLVVLYVTVRPFSLSAYRRLSCTWGFAPFLDAISILLPGTRICWTADSDIPSPISSAVLVANHVIATDWWALFLVSRCVALRGTMKAFLRNEYLHLNMQDVVVDPRASAGSASNDNIRGSSTMSSSSLIPSLSNKQAPTNGQSNSSSNTRHERSAAPDLALMAKLLHLFLEFPLINDEASDREPLSALLRSIASTDTGSIVHLLHYPEGWCNHNGSDRQSVLAKCNEFAKREGKPVLKHLLLPRSRGFHSSLECLRESRPHIYDVTMAYKGYDGSIPVSINLSMPTLWDYLRRKFPREIHLRVKRYSLDEVLQDSNWLFKKWTEKDRLLEHFARYQQFPIDCRGYGQYRIFDSRTHSFETSIVALITLLLLPCCVPVLLFLSFPLFWTLLVLWCSQRAITFVFADPSTRQSDYDNLSDHRNGGSGNGGDSQTPGSASLAGTPFLPATPFASPTLMNWRDLMSSSSSKPASAEN